jgi:dTDP-4-dehydrorhamnose 3,5-epimerase
MTLFLNLSLNLQIVKNGMEIIDTNIAGVKLIKPKVFGDERGYFFESFNNNKLASLLAPGESFVQDNQSMSKANVLRGLHFQHPPHSQGKLVRVVKGSVLDVAVDIRKDSPTYGHNYSIELSDKNHYMLWIPKGMAHGFMSLEDDTIFSYKCTDYYFPELEDCILYNDDSLKINWNTSNPIISEKDKKGKLFNSFISPF